MPFFFVFTSCTRGKVTQGTHFCLPTGLPCSFSFYLRLRLRTRRPRGQRMVREMKTPEERMKKMKTADGKRKTPSVPTQDKMKTDKSKWPRERQKYAMCISLPVTTNHGQSCRSFWVRVLLFPLRSFVSEGCDLLGVFFFFFIFTLTLSGWCFDLIASVWLLVLCLDL